MTISRAPARARGERWFDRIPLFVMLCAIASLAMFVPALFGWVNADHDSGRPFLYGGIVFFGLSVLVALSTRSKMSPKPSRSLLLSLLGAYLALPAILALPMVEAVQGLSFRNAYFEMVSSITTTGATIFAQPNEIAPTIHLWRSLVGWMGGFLVWVSAIAVLAPLRLGGFEMLLTSAEVGRNNSLGRSVMAVYPMQRIWRYSCDLGPVYFGLSFALWLVQLIAGEEPFIAACLAMATLSSSGISPIASLGQTVSGLWGEAMILLFFVFSISRVTFASDMPVPMIRRKYQDPELRMAAVIILAVPTLMFLHHWLATLEIGLVMPVGDVLRAAWGAVFTTVSFLTTNGLVSEAWPQARTWSGLTTPGLILMGLAMVGGGVATTAGGVKLLRVYGLYKHGQLEVSRLIHPSMVASPGNPARRVRQESAYVAWLFFMLFALSVTAIMLAVSLFRVEFETATVLTIAALSNTGPLTAIAADTPIPLATLDVGVQMILCVAMVMGRLETLAIIALLNPDFWRP